MAKRTTNLATLYIGVNEVAGITSLVQGDPENVAVYSDELVGLDAGSLLAVDPPTSGRGMTMDVEVDDEDTNGQLALDTAKTSRATVDSVVFYPYGKITGNPTYTGSIKVISAGQIGSTGNTAKARKRQYKMLWVTEPVAGTES